MSNLISRTGRVQSWIDDPQSRLPVSCTTFVVEDSMEGTTASKLAGDSQATHYVMVQAVQSTCLSLDQPDIPMTKDLWLLAQSALVKYIQL